jgi:hypothetical protein
LFKQFGVAATLNNATVFQDKDFIGINNGG